MHGKVSLYCTDTEIVRKQYQVFGLKQRNTHFIDELLFNFVSRFIKYQVFRYKQRNMQFIDDLLLHSNDTVSRLIKYQVFRYKQRTCTSLMIYYLILCQDSLNIRSSDTNKGACNSLMNYYFIVMILCQDSWHNNYKRYVRLFCWTFNWFDGYTFRFGDRFES